MQLLIVRQSGAGDKVFELFGEDVAIGRSRDADLFLDSQSVSRHHAVLSWKAGTYRIDDENSNNGVWVNGERIQGAGLESGDAIRLGDYELIYVDGPLPRRYRKLDIPSMDHWHQVTWQGMTEEHTLQLSVDAMKRLVAARTHLEMGTLVGHDDAWLLGDEEWILGRAGRIPVSGGWWVSRCAEVRWNGRNHVLRRISRWVPVRVNGRTCVSCILEDHDEIAVGRSRLHYAIGSGEE